MIDPSRPALAMSQQLAADPGAVAAEQGRLKNNPQAAAKAAAAQFEALLISTLLKNMRINFSGEEASNSLDTYQSLYDQQMAQVLAQRGGLGLSEVLYQQMAQQAGLPADKKTIYAHTASTSLPIVSTRRAVRAYHNAISPESEPLRVEVASTKPTVRSAPQKTPVYVPPALDMKPVSNSHPAQQAFIQQILPHAYEAAAQLGVSPYNVVAHAALESGWGKRAIRHPDGQASHNLFGIKAGKHWAGKTVQVVTTEYEEGRAVKRVETFRAYDSYTHAFNDYARLLKQSPRYHNVLSQGNNAQGFARALQGGGYATDPFYAQKLVAVASALNKLLL